MKPSGSKPKAFLTGATGFLGPHVIASLAAEGFDVFSSSTPLNDLATLRKELGLAKWDLVFHLAGLSLPADCEKDPAHAYEVNLAGTIEFAGLCQEADVRGPFIFFSTAYVYAPTLQGVITEESPVEPRGIYGKTKFAAEQALRDIAKKTSFPVLALRLFNHSHKTQRPDFFLPAMYQTLLGAKQKIVDVPMGDPTLKRDFSSLQDLRTRIAKIAANRDGISRTVREKHEGFLVCNVCSGQARELGRLVHQLATKMGLEARLQPQPDRMRAGEPVSVCGSPSVLDALLESPSVARTDDEFIELFLADIASGETAHDAVHCQRGST